MAKPKSPAPIKRITKRRPGRPSNDNAEPVSRDAIINRALELCRRDSLQNVSIVRVATELGVTPALIHYYVGGRDRLTSGVMNSFYRSLVEQLPPVASDWGNDVTNVFNTIYASYIRFSGIVAYVMSHNRFRVFQLVENDERDYGADFFERVAGSVRLAGLMPQRTAMFMHLLLQHVLSSAYQQASHQLPEDHQAYLVSRLRKLKISATPNTHFLLESFAALRGDDAFSTGLELIVNAMEREPRPNRARQAHGRRRPGWKSRTASAEA